MQGLPPDDPPDQAMVDGGGVEEATGLGVLLGQGRASRTIQGDQLK